MSETDLKARVLEYLGSVDEASVRSIADATDATTDEVKEVLRPLLDEGAVSSTIDWNYAATANDGEKIADRETIAETGKLERDEEEILDLAARLDAYPYSGGTGAHRYNGANMVAKWLLGERDDIDVPGVERRQMKCQRCDWTQTEYVHRGRVPRLCPECGGADTIEATPVEE